MYFPQNPSYKSIPKGSLRRAAGVAGFLDDFLRLPMATGRQVSGQCTSPATVIFKVTDRSRDSRVCCWRGLIEVEAELPLSVAQTLDSCEVSSFLGDHSRWRYAVCHQGLATETRSYPPHPLLPFGHAPLL